MARNWDLDSEELLSSILADFPIGREEELAATSRRYESEKSEFLAIYEWNSVNGLTARRLKYNRQ